MKTRTACAEATASLLEIYSEATEALVQLPDSPFRHYVFEVGYAAKSAINEAMTEDNLSRKLAILRTGAARIRSMESPTHEGRWSNARTGNAGNWLRNVRGMAGHVADGFSASEFGGSPSDPVVSVIGQ